MKNKSKKELKQTMTKNLSNPLFEAITTGENQALKLYAILDAARSSNIYMQIDIVEHYNLFGEDVAEMLEEAAPYLVELDQEEVFTKSMLQEEYGNASMLFVYSTHDMETLATFFRSYTTVDVDGQQAFFAFYDPRVFERFMKRASSEELESFYSLVSCYACEKSTDTDYLVLYEYKDKVVSKEIQVKESD